MSDRIKLKPISPEMNDYKWCSASLIHKKYALVGRNSQQIHMMFLSPSLIQAKDICSHYNDTMDDAGYDLMVVDE